MTIVLYYLLVVSEIVGVKDYVCCRFVGDLGLFLLRSDWVIQLHWLQHGLDVSSPMSMGWYFIWGRE